MKKQTPVNELRPIYSRVYDKPLNDDGTEKHNELLGRFRVVHQIFEDMYSEEFIGFSDEGKYFLVTGSEVAGFNGGIRYAVKELAFIPELIVKAQHHAAQEAREEVAEKFMKELSWHDGELDDDYDNGRSHEAKYQHNRIKSLLATYTTKKNK